MPSAVGGCVRALGESSSRARARPPCNRCTGLFRKNVPEIWSIDISRNFPPIGTNETVLESSARNAFDYVAGFPIFCFFPMFRVERNLLLSEVNS